MMSTQINSTAEQVKAYCTRIGKDPLLVQGAGGNVSWKDGSILWVKASGTWLADAEQKDIFVPIDLPHLLKALDDGDFSVEPRLCRESLLRPSIETLLHALMPSRVVVHLHAIEVLAHLVRDNFQADFESLLDESTPWAVVDYYKPGSALAAEISATLTQKPTTKVIFLRNHGVVIGGADVAEADQIICKLTLALSTRPADICPPSHLMFLPPANLIDQYAPVADLDIHQLALTPDLFNRVNSDWALYPDHVVFLGPRAYVYQTWEAFNDQKIFLIELPELVFVKGKGVYAKSSFNKAKQVQLRCYFDVIVRQKPHSSMRVLTDIQIAELLNWDAEQYRMNLAK
ncbi:class II aldolase/adducin family protein [Solimicrobium silvestre]|uniref:Class II aldolase/adducin N-terminal domain-containing protein n=1 Tax=Solimicrobium silvestre TaxID=2099400 RepID=A0A2S9H291_9BURK|nr:class II aldolase/adducin family protein [Solimicrobium silvestre]PRC93976.1 hypothetical protein S2091_1149 [Solimicrobium silvestre]